MQTFTTFPLGRRSRWLVIGTWVLLAVALAGLQPKLQDQGRGRERDVPRARGRVDHGAPPARLALQGGSLVDRGARLPGDARLDLRAVRAPSRTRSTRSAHRRRCRISRASAARAASRAVTSATSSARRRRRRRSPTTRRRRCCWSRSSTARTTRSRSRATSPRSAGSRPSRPGTRSAATSPGRRASTPIAARPSRASTGRCWRSRWCSSLVLMLLTYRSPLIAALMLGVVAIAYLIATGAVYGLVEAGATTVSGQSTAILIVLMFGAGTDYCLLIVSRYRDELRRDGDVEAAMARAPLRTVAGDPRVGRDRGRGDARPRPRRLQRDARDGADPRARHRRDDGGRADAAAGAAGGVRAARVLARGPGGRARARHRSGRAGRA